MTNFKAYLIIFLSITSFLQSCQDKEYFFTDRDLEFVNFIEPGDNYSLKGIIDEMEIVISISEKTFDVEKVNPALGLGRTRFYDVVRFACDIQVDTLYNTTGIINYTCSEGSFGNVYYSLGSSFGGQFRLESMSDTITINSIFYKDVYSDEGITCF